MFSEITSSASGCLDQQQNTLAMSQRAALNECASLRAVGRQILVQQKEGEMEHLDTIQCLTIPIYCNIPFMITICLPLQSHFSVLPPDWTQFGSCKLESPLQDGNAIWLHSHSRFPVLFRALNMVLFIHSSVSRENNKCIV